jgi:hypothetical protein
VTDTSRYGSVTTAIQLRGVSRPGDEPTHGHGFKGSGSEDWRPKSALPQFAAGLSCASRAAPTSASCRRCSARTPSRKARLVGGVVGLKSYSKQPASATAGTGRLAVMGNRGWPSLIRRRGRVFRARRPSRHGPWQTTSGSPVWISSDCLTSHCPDSLMRPSVTALAPDGRTPNSYPDC